jgi:hypothetical protein
MLYFVDSYKLNPSFGAVAPTPKPQSGPFYFLYPIGSTESNVPIRAKFLCTYGMLYLACDRVYWAST